jgi:hypothetical protein
MITAILVILLIELLTPLLGLLFPPVFFILLLALLFSIFS